MMTLLVSGLLLVTGFAVLAGHLHLSRDENIMGSSLQLCIIAALLNWAIAATNIFIIWLDKSGSSPTPYRRHYDAGLEQY